MYVEVLKYPCDLVIVLSKVWVRILLNEIISVSNNILNCGQYGSSRRKEKRALFLGAGVQFVKKIYFDVCKLLRADAFVDMYKRFEANVHYSASTLKIINKHILDRLPFKKVW